MNDFIKKIIGDKKEWRAMEARANTLPSDYRFFYNEIKGYLWSGAGPLDGSVDLFKGLLDLFEGGAADNKPVLEITGRDVAAFCDELVQGEKTYMQNCREKLNRNIAKKIGKE